MKNIIINFFLTFVFCLFYIISNAQVNIGPKPAEECNKPKECPPKLYPYYFCNGDKIVAICSTDPNINPNLEDYPEFNMPVKINLPICLTFVNSGPDTGIVNLCIPGRCVNGHLVYKKSDMQSQINQVMKRINCLCDKENEPCQCNIKVKFSNNRLDFVDDYDPSSNMLKMWSKKNDPNILNPNDCSLNCENITIYLNNSDEFTGRGEYNPNNPKHLRKFFVIDDYFYSDLFINESTTISAYNMLDILNYEIGGLLGLGDPHTVLIPPCEVEGLLYNEPKSGFDCKKSTNMSDDDKCMIIKKYCSPTGIEDLKNNNTIIVNNGNDLIIENIDIIYPVSKIEIFNSNGNIVNILNSNSIKYESNKCIIDVNNLANGLYIIFIYDIKNNIKFAKYLLVK